MVSHLFLLFAIFACKQTVQITKALVFTQNTEALKYNKAVGVVL